MFTDHLFYVDECLPAAQGVQATELAGAYVPALHCWGKMVGSEHSCPAVHAVQDD